MTIFFKNPGVAELRALTTMGVNVKESNNPIGFFGTGFKYAVAGILRAGGRISIFLGLEKYRFAVTRVSIRGKDHDIVTLIYPDESLQELGFTTDIGKTWEAWMFYRELRCNALDEEGYVSTNQQRAEPGHTLIVVDDYDQMEVAHERRHEYFIEGAPVYSLQDCEAYSSLDAVAKCGFYYRGILVGEWDRPSYFRWNINGRMILTEDRKCASVYSAQNTIRYAVQLSEDPDLVEKVLTVPLDFMESKLDFSSAYAASDVFLNVAQRLADQGNQNLNITVYKILAAQRNYDPYTRRELRAVESKMLAKAEKVCTSIGLNTGGVDIQVVENLGEGVLGKVVNGKIYLTGEVFRQGTKRVAGTLVEEMIHLRYGLEDETRQMQNHLIDRIVSLVEELQGEPL